MTNLHSPQKFEIYFLYALAFFLPLYEAPKNLAVAMVTIMWIIRSFTSSNWGHAWSKWDTSAVSIILAGLASVFFGLYPVEKGISAAGDILSYSLIFIFLRRTRLSDAVIKNMFIIAIISTFLTLILGYWTHFNLQATSHLQLNSVGHVNHSAIYLAIIIASTLALTITENFTPLKLAILALLFFFIFSISVMSARGAILPLILFVFVMLLVKRKTLKRSVMLAISSIFAAAVILGAFLGAGAIEKTSSNFAHNNYTSKRLELANTAYTAVKESPVFGLGLNNFGKISEINVRLWVEKHGNAYNSEHFFYSSHAHNLYFNTLATEGVIGLLAIVGFLSLIGHHILTRLPSDHPTKMMLWWSSLGAWMIVVFGGIFNTTLHHEHGMLAMIIFGIWLGHDESSNRAN